MKKITTLSLLLFCLFLVPNNLSAQALSQNNFIVDAYYGFPNFGRTLISSLEDDANPNSEFTARGIGPAGVRLEYMLSSRIGLGVDAIFNSNGADFQRDTTFYNSQTDQFETRIDDVTIRQRRLRIHLRFNYHFNISNPRLDGYFGVGAGTNNRFYTETINGAVDPSASASGTLLPFSVRVCTGLRYYFTQNIGVNAEIGLGGPLVSAGLSLKF